MSLNWPKKLQTKFLLGLTAITFAGGLLFATALYYHMRDLLESEAKDKATLVLSQAHAIQNYVRTTLRPTMYSILPPEQFIIETMSSSYISRRVMENVELQGSDFTYRRVAINARNPRFEATPRELKLIEHFQKNPFLQEWTGVEKFNGGEYICVSRPVRFQKSCMNCHGSPENSPAQLIERYGAKRGFHRNEGEILGLTEVLVPLSSGMIEIRGATMGSVSFAVAGALFCFAVANMLFNRLVVHNLRRLAQVFPKYFSKQAETSLLERLNKGNEIKEVMRSVEDLAMHLSAAQSKLGEYAQNLEHMVDERTADLAREASDRRSDVELFVRLLHTLNRSHTRRQLIESALPKICRRYGVDSASYVCTFASHTFYSWPDADMRPPLPEQWQQVITEAKPVFTERSAFIPVQPQLQVVEGILCLFWNDNGFDPHRVGDVLVALGRQLGVAMENLNFQDRLLQQNDMLQSIFEGISDPLLLLDDGCSILMANSAALELTGEAAVSRTPGKDACLATLFGELTPSCSIPSLKSLLREGDPCSFELSEPGARSFLVNIYPLPMVENQQQRLVLYARENTAEKNMLAQIQQHEKQITVGRLAAGLAHEINNPLGVILTYAELLQSSCNTQQDCEDVDVIIQHTRKAQKVLHDLLNFARPKQVSHSFCDPAEVLRNLANVFSVQAEVRRVSLNVDLHDNLPLVMADPVALEQIISNLLLNALDAAPAKAGRITMTARLVGAEKGTPLLRIIVADNGPGISHDIIGRIFDPFFSTKDVGKGTGLGLAVVYGLVQELNGRITVWNDEGAVFCLHIPVGEPLNKEPSP